MPQIDTCACACVAATKIQAKYKGHRVKGDYQKQKEAGLYFSVLFFDDDKMLQVTRVRCSHQDRELLARPDGQKGARKEGMGCRDHQEVQSTPPTPIVTVKNRIT